MDESIAELNQAVTLVRAGELKINTSEIRLILAQAYLRRGDTGSARDALVAAHAEAPDSPRITMALAELLFALHDYDEVISTLNTPQKPYEGYVLQAKAYMGRHAKGDDREALSQLGKAHALRPDAPEVYVALGQCAIMTRNFDEAVKEFDEAIKLNPNDTVARLSKAIAYEVAKNPAKVDQTYREALTALPKVMTLRYEYARYLARSNRFDEGEKVLLDEISRLSDDPTGRKE
jgi:Tfp pilus assembly protein PilF